MNGSPIASTSDLTHNSLNISESSEIFLGKISRKIDDILCSYGTANFKGFVTANEYATKYPKQFKRISFGCNSLDKLTRNGIKTQGITEIYGEAGAGKSQICMQLALMVQLPEYLGGLKKGTAFICTESIFPSNRLNEISNEFTKNYPNLNIKFNENVFVQHCINAEQLLFSLSTTLTQLLNIHRIGLIIIDSVAGIFRNYTDYLERAIIMKKMSKLLLNLCDEYGCAIVCTNQVVSAVGTSNLNLLPCLGLAWSNLINTRMEVSKTEKLLIDTSFDNNTTYPIREMKVHVSVDLPPRLAQFTIVTKGLSDVSEAFKSL